MRSIQEPLKSVKATKFASQVITSARSDPIRLANAACPVTAWPPAAQPLGIVHVLVSGQPPEDRLAKLSDERVATILACPGIGKSLFGQLLRPPRAAARWPQ